MDINMLRKALWIFIRPLIQLISNLLNPEIGEEWLMELKKFLRKEPCWVKKMFLQFEKTFNYNGMVIDCHKQIEDGTYANIFDIDPSKPESYSQFVILPDLPDRNDKSFYSKLDIRLNNFADVVKKDTGQDIFKNWTHLIILAAGKPIVAYAYRNSGGTLDWHVASLTDYCWHAQGGRRFLFRRLA